MRRRPRRLATCGLFAGIGGFELGLSGAGHPTVLLCEQSARARRVLALRFPGTAQWADIATLSGLPAGTELVSAGFPCQDLSSAGTKAGIDGPRTGIVHHVFRLLATARPPWVLLETVPFALHLDRGRAARRVAEGLERLGYRWAWRVLDSREFGLAQRRRRLFILGASDDDPRDVLLGDEQPPTRWPTPDIADHIGFYWTEGRRGHSLTADAVPPIKAGSQKGFKNAPAVLTPAGRVVYPTLKAAEELQGFPPGWTDVDPGRPGAHYRWAQLGNAVSVPVARWLGDRLARPARYEPGADPPVDASRPLPYAAYNVGPGRRTAPVGPRAAIRPAGSLASLDTGGWPALSSTAARGFAARARAGGLAYPEGFIERIEAFAEEDPHG